LLSFGQYILPKLNQSLRPWIPAGHANHSESIVGLPIFTQAELLIQSTEINPEPNLEERLAESFINMAELKDPVRIKA